MSHESEQLKLIEEAHSQRGKDGISDETLTFFDTAFDCVGLRLLSDLRPDLKGLYLMSTQVSDEGFEAINGFHQLEILNIEQTALKASGFRKMSPSIPLKGLTISPGHISPAIFAHFASFSSLRSFSFGTIISFVDVRDKRWPGKPVDDCLVELTPLTELVDLNARGCILEGPGLEAVLEMRNIETLCLDHTLTPAKWLSRLNKIQRLKSLHLGKTGLDDDAFEALTELEDLEDLYIADVAISDTSIRMLPRFKNLKALILEDLAISQEACECLREIHTLKYIEGNIDGISDEFWQSLVDSIPDLWVHP